MKKIKFIMLALLAVVATASFVACGDDDNSNNNGTSDSNWDTYQAAVDNEVNTLKAQTKNTKALLLVAFGSTWQNAFAAFDATKKAYQEKYPDYDVYLSYSSNICINRAAAGENGVARNYYSPENWLESFGRAQYSTIVVQSLQVIRGEEFNNVVSFIKAFGNNRLRDLDDDYLSKVKVYLGLPLMTTDDDVDNLASVLNDEFKDEAQKGVVMFMGHGNPDSYDTYKANISYTQLETALQKYSKNYYVGTVDMAKNYKVQVRQRMKANGITSGKFYLQALMSIAGDHAHNDMAGDDFDEEAIKADTDTKTDEVEGTSWKKYFQYYGFEYVDLNGDGSLLGLLEYPEVLQLWMNHTAEAIEGEPLDIYHSMNPE